MVKSDLNKLFGHVKAIISQISSQDKLKSTNKHFGNLWRNWKWDSFEGKIQVGPRASQIKAMVKIPSLVGGGFNEPNWKGSGPLRWPEHHHQGGGVELWSVQQRVGLPCSWVWAWTQANKKFLKMEQALISRVEVVNFGHKKFQYLNQVTKITVINAIFDISAWTCNLTRMLMPQGIPRTRWTWHLIFMRRKPMALLSMLQNWWNRQGRGGNNDREKADWC